MILLSVIFISGLHSSSSVQACVFNFYEWMILLSVILTIGLHWCGFVQASDFDTYKRIIFSFSILISGLYRIQSRVARSWPFFLNFWNVFQTERDVSVRQRAVDLLYAMCDRSNAEEIVSEMLAYLETADYSIREEMVRLEVFFRRLSTAF